MKPSVGTWLAATSTFGSEGPQQYMHWSPGKKAAFIYPGTETQAELEWEAATMVQSSFRHHLKGVLSDGSESSIASHCERCGEGFAQSQLSDGYADRCDLFGGLLHTWCVVCCSNESKGVPPATCSTEDPAPENCYGKGTNKTKEEQVHSAPLDSTSSGDGSFGDLDTTLEYVIKFLEGDHAKSSQISGATRSSILSKVKDVLQWKKRPRTEPQISEHVAELNSMMMNKVARL